MVWKRNPTKAKTTTVSLLIAASLVLLAGITPPAGADTPSDLQQLADMCIEEAEPQICVPNLDQICGDVGPVSCEFEADTCHFFCEDDQLPLITPAIGPLTIPGVEAWVSQCGVPSGLMIPQVSVDEANKCPIGQNNICDDDANLEYGDFPGGSTLCWRVFIPEDTHQVPDGFTIDDVNVPISLAALCQGTLAIWVGDVNVVPGATAVAPCSEGS